MNPLYNLAESIFIDIFLAIDAVIYSFASFLYRTYLQIANARIFTDETIQIFAERIYIVIGIVALFLVTYSLMQMVINPEKGKENGKYIAQRLVISIVLVPLIPLIFNFLYEFQNSILSNNVITNFVLGTFDPSSIDGLNDQNTQVESTIMTSRLKKINNDVVEVPYYACSTCDPDDLENCTDIVMAVEGTEESPDMDKPLTIDHFSNSNPCTSGKFLVMDTTLDTEIVRQEIIGNQMVSSILFGFINPLEDADDIKLTIDNGFFNDTTPVFGALIGCGIGLVAGGVVSIVSMGVAVPAWVAIASTCASGIIVGGTVGIVADGVSDFFDTENTNFSDARAQILRDGSFNLITSFSNPIAIGELEYTFLISTIVGIVLLYMLFSFTLDLGIRAIKLAFYQMIAPVPIFMSISPKNKDLLGNWFKLVLTTYAEVFVRILCFAGVAFFAVSIAPNIQASFGMLGTAIIYMGIVAFAFQFPKILGEVTGIKSGNLKLGIGEKLKDGGFFVAASAVTSLGRTGFNSAALAVRKYKADKGKGKIKNRRDKTKAVLGAMKSVASDSLSGAFQAGRRAKDVKKFKEMGLSVERATRSTMKSRNKKIENKERQQNEIKTLNEGLTSEIDEKLDTMVAKHEAATGMKLVGENKIKFLEENRKHARKAVFDSRKKSGTSVFRARINAGKIGDAWYDAKSYLGLKPDFSKMESEFKVLDELTAEKAKISKNAGDMTQDVTTKTSVKLATQLMNDHISSKGFTVTEDGCFDSLGQEIKYADMQKQMKFVIAENTTFDQYLTEETKVQKDIFIEGTVVNVDKNIGNFKSGDRITDLNKFNDYITALNANGYTAEADKLEEIDFEEKPYYVIYETKEFPKGSKITSRKEYDDYAVSLKRNNKEIRKEFEYQFAKVLSKGDEDTLQYISVDESAQSGYGGPLHNWMKTSKASSQNTENIFNKNSELFRTAVGDSNFKVVAGDYDSSKTASDSGSNYKAKFTPIYNKLKAEEEQREANKKKEE